MYIKPIKPFKRKMETAPDKSITHRAIMLNSFAHGDAIVSNALLGGDCISTIECMRALGAKIDVSGSTVRVKGASSFTDASVNAQNSGTTARLLAGVVCGRGKTTRICGDESLSKRPMNRVILPLEMMGANISSDDGKLPMTVIGSKLVGINYSLPTPSAQVKSAIILAALSAGGVTNITEETACRNHTEIMLKAMGADIKIRDNIISVKRSELKSVDVRVPGDISSAAYLLGLAAVVRNASVTVKNVGLNPTRAGIIDVLKQMGADITVTHLGGFEPEGDITLNNAPLKPFKITAEMVPSLIDELPLLAAIACFADGRSIISGAEELKVKESDRITTTVNALKNMGAKITATQDGMIIDGECGLHGDGTINSFGDHRIAMMGAVAAAGSKFGGNILNEDCAFISYPNFFSMFE